MIIKFPKKITILSCDFKVIQDKLNGGGSFSTSKGEIIIGTKYLKDDPNSVFNTICHEIMEIIHSLMCTRYNDGSVHGNYKFFQDHKEFQTSICIFAQIIQQFIK